MYIGLLMYKSLIFRAQKPMTKAYQPTAALTSILKYAWIYILCVNSPTASVTSICKYACWNSTVRLKSTNEHCNLISGITVL